RSDPLELRAKRPVAMAGHELDVLQKLAARDTLEEVLVAQEPVVTPVRLPAPALAGRGRHGHLDLGHALEELVDERSLAGARRARDDEHRRHRDHPHYRLLKRPISSVRCRSESPPTVFDWLIRHVLRKRAALTRPNFGTAIRMSITFAVETYSGGLPRICSIRILPSLRSFLSLARLTRTSFARLRASIRWSRERSGACACILVGLTAGRSYQCARDLQAGTFRSVSGLFPRLFASSGLATPTCSQASASSLRTRAGALGSAKRMVPSATSPAPQAANSSASRPVWIPPIPTIGSLVASWQTVTACRATGFSAGPDSPPLPRASTGCSSRSRAIARKVLMSERPSAPAAATARATSAMSGCAADSLA